MRLLIFILVVVALAAPTSQIKADHFTASLLRSDAVLVPFAEYRNGRWKNPWAKAADFSDTEPNALADLPEPWFAKSRLPSPLWHFLSRRGKAHLLNASKVVQVDNHCQKLWGIVSDLPKEEAVDARFGYVGVALNLDRKVNPAYELNQTQNDWTRLHSFIQSEFDKEEQARANDLGKFLKPPRREEQKNKSVTLSYLYQMTIGESGERLYYFEALKEYKKPIPLNDQTCNNVFFNGWISTKSDELKLIDSKMGWKDCEPGLDSIPLGLLKLDDGVFIFTVEFDYEGDRYLILRLNESRMQTVLETYGGSC
jgi:hypothetical protein